MINKEFVEARQADAQKELDSCTTELISAKSRVEELQLLAHNIKVQLATYDDLLVDSAPAIEAEVKETIESLVAE